MATYDVLPVNFTDVDPNALTMNVSYTTATTRVAVGISVDSINNLSNVDWKYFPNVTVDDSMVTCNVITTLLNANAYISEDMNVADVISIIWDVILSEEVNVLDNAIFDPNLYRHISERLVLDGIVTANTNANLLVVEAINMLDGVIKAFGKNVIDTLNIPSNIVDNISAMQVIAESLNVTASANNVMSMIAVLSDDVNVTDTATINQILNLAITDSFTFSGGITFDNSQYTFVLNTENEAISSYTNYNFNSISEGLAASSTGIFELSGADDDGTIIDSSFKTAVMDFGESFHKQVPYMYIGFSNNEEMLVKTITNGTVRWYTAIKKNSTDQNTRVDFGKGVKARYWQFELMNLSGADFDVESIELTPVLLKRRI